MEKQLNESRWPNPSCDQHESNSFFAIKFQAEIENSKPYEL